MAKRLFQNWTQADERTLITTGVIAASLLITHDLVGDPDGSQCKQAAALADYIIGVAMEDYTTGQMVRVIYRAGAVVPIICVDAAIAPGVAVYSALNGKVSATVNGAAIGVTLSSSAAANTLVAIKLF